MANPSIYPGGLGMATQGVELQEYSSEAQTVLGLIEQGKNFLLSGGAGSGKTYSLIEVIRVVISTQPLARIACVTYTNAAVREINERAEHPNLAVSTIHEFLWRSIKHFQEELKTTIIELINDEDQSKFKKIEGEVVDASFFDHLDEAIQYKEFVRIKDGIISHDELLDLAHRMYEKYPKLCDITKDNYPYIFVDEYQDTDPQVVEILLGHLEKSDKRNIVGFFGDAMQSIYDGRISNLDQYLSGERPLITEVQKLQNRRNPKLVMDLANNLRSDYLIQEPSEDITAPNMDENGKIKEGSIKFLYSNNSDLGRVRRFLDWDFSNSKQVKELNLTHNLIAEKAGFKELMRIYDGDKILDYVKRIKKYIKANHLAMDTYGKTFGDIVGELKLGKIGRELKKVLPTGGMQLYIDANKDQYLIALLTAYDELSKIYVDKDQLLDDKKNDLDDEGKIGSNRDDLIKHLFKIQHNLKLYSDGEFNEFLRKTEYKVSSVAEKKELKERIEELINVGDQTILEVIKKADEYGIVRVDERLLRFKSKKAYVYDQVINFKFSLFQKLYEYLEGYTPFSTQHKTKGAEFPSVLVILDNGSWNSYNFENLFTGEGRETVLHRSQKIFYVCCTRAKEQLAVFYHAPSEQVIGKAKEWFGNENVINIDS